MNKLYVSFSIFINNNSYITNQKKEKKIEQDHIVRNLKLLLCSMGRGLQ